MSKLLNIKIYNNETENGKAKEVYVYNILKDHIYNNFTKYKSIVETNKNQNIARGTISLYIDTNVPFRGKLYYSQPISNIEEIFNSVKKLSSELKVNSNIAQSVWAYDAKTLELVKGSPFISKSQASRRLGISRVVINYFIDTFKAEGVKGTYLFSKPLNNKDINKLLDKVDSLKLGNKKSECTMPKL